MAEDRELERLKQVVAAYGAEPARWPEGERERLEPIAGGAVDAPWMAEARDVDALLDAVPGARLTDGMAGAIVAAAAAIPRALPDRVVEMPSRRRPWRLPRRLLARSGPATILAASLLAGIWLGATGQIDALVNGPSMGLDEWAPGVNDETSLSVLWWDAVNPNESLP